VESAVTDRSADIPHAGGSTVTQSRFAFTGKRHTSSDIPPDTKEDIRIDTIPEGDDSPYETPEDELNRKKSSEISYAERKTGRKS
jgi:hypothetical protein